MTEALTYIKSDTKRFRSADAHPSRGRAVEARRAHNPEVVGSNPTPATNNSHPKGAQATVPLFLWLGALAFDHGGRGRTRRGYSMLRRARSAWPASRSCVFGAVRLSFRASTCSNGGGLREDLCRLHQRWASKLTGAFEVDGESGFVKHSCDLSRRTHAGAVVTDRCGCSSSLWACGRGHRTSGTLMCRNVAFKNFDDVLPQKSR